MGNWIREIGICFDGLIVDLACIDVACHAAFLSTPRGLMRPVPTGALRAWVGRLCLRGL